MTFSISPIRRFTPDDRARLNASATRFAQRHGLQLDANEPDSADALNTELWFRNTGTDPRVKELARLWQACRCRALRVKVDASITVAWGYIGYSAS